MNKKSFNAWRKNMGNLSVEESGLLLGKKANTIKNYAYKDLPIPETVEILCNLLLKNKD